MKTQLLLTLLCLTPLAAIAGKEGGGADIYETRFHFALNRAKHALQSTNSVQDSNQKAAWIKVIDAVNGRPIERSEAQRLFDENREKAALALPLDKPNRIVLNIPYFEDKGVTPDETFVLAVHETGHLVGIADHQKLDEMGRNLLAEVSTQSIRAIGSSGGVQQKIFEMFTNKNLTSEASPKDIEGIWEGRCWVNEDMFPKVYFLHFRRAEPVDSGPLFVNPEVFQGWQSAVSDDWQFRKEVIGDGARLGIFDANAGLWNANVNQAINDPVNDAIATPFRVSSYGSDCFQDKQFKTICGRHFAIRKFGDYLFTVNYRQNVSTSSKFELVSPETGSGRYCYYFQKYPEPKK